MKTNLTSLTVWLVYSLWLLPACSTSAQELQSPKYSTGQRTFSSAKRAAGALFEAAKANDQAMLQVILGPEAKDLISSGDRVADENNRLSFVKKYSQRHALSAKSKDTEELQIGNDSWPFPIPIRKDDGRWRFDSAAGREEILARRIGRNELDTIRSCRAFVEAQREYAQKSWDGESPGVYAAKLVSDPGKKNGLYWEVREGEPPSPLGPMMADANAEGYGQSGGKRPFHGYFYRLLTAQGANAPGGAKNYLEDGKMKHGFALVAFPAEYRVSGIMTFIVSHEGQVYQRDLGEKTIQAAYQLREYNPDKSWAVVH